MTFGERRRWPMVTRLFVLIAATVVGVQLLDWALIVALPAPPPRTDSLSRMAAILSGRATDATGYVVERWTRLPPGPRGFEDLALRARFAAALGVAPDRVRTRSDAAPDVVGRAYETNDRPPPPGADTVYAPLIVSLRLADGSWRSVHPVAAWIDPSRWRALMWMIVVALTVAAPAWWLARRLVRPYRLFAAAAQRIGNDPRAPPLPLTGAPELREATAAFNEMQRLIHRYVNDRVTIVGALAHDLRTPLMRIAMRLDKAPSPLREAAEEDIGEMRDRIAATLAFVRDLAQPVVRRPIDLGALVESVVAERVDRGCEVTLLPGPRPVIDADPASLKSALGNLVDNACLYAGAAEVSVVEAPGIVRLHVTDHGPGMAADDLARAFEPFFRGESSRNRDTGGIGLGLASVRAIAIAHGGEAALSHRDRAGMIATITLPDQRSTRAMLC